MTMNKRYAYFARLICTNNQAEFEYCYAKLVGNNHCNGIWYALHHCKVAKIEEKQNKACPLIIQPKSLREKKYF